MSLKKEKRLNRKREGKSRGGEKDGVVGNLTTPGARAGRTPNSS